MYICRAIRKKFIMSINVSKELSLHCTIKNGMSYTWTVHGKFVVDTIDTIINVVNTQQWSFSRTSRSLDSILSRNITKTQWPRPVVDGQVEVSEFVEHVRLGQEKKERETKREKEKETYRNHPAVLYWRRRRITYIVCGNKLPAMMHFNGGDNFINS